MASHRQVLEAVAKQKERYRLRQQEALERRLKEEKARKLRAEIEADRERRARAWVGLKQSFGTGNDTIATEAASLVSMDLLASTWEDGGTSLHSAAAQGLLECCESIMTRDDFQGFESMLQVRDNRGWTPLHCAVGSADRGAEICELLAMHPKCCVGIKDNEGRTAADLAQQYGLDCARAAIKQATEMRYAPIAARKRQQEEEEAAQIEFVMSQKLSWHDDAGSQMGFKLFAAGQIEDLIELIQNAWPFINEIDANFAPQGRCRTLLHYAAHKGESEVCEAILDRHDWKSTDVVDLDRATALHLAAATHHVDCIIAIIASGTVVDINIGDMRDQTALHLAALRGDSECYNALLAHPDVDLGRRDYRKKLATEYAIERGLEVLPPVLDAIDPHDLPIDNPELEVDL